MARRQHFGHGTANSAGRRGVPSSVISCEQVGQVTQRESLLVWFRLESYRKDATMPFFRTGGRIERFAGTRARHSASASSHQGLSLRERVPAKAVHERDYAVAGVSRTRGRRNGYGDRLDDRQCAPVQLRENTA